MPKQSARRNMDDALKLTPEAVQFIQGATEQTEPVARAESQADVTEDRVIDVTTTKQPTKPKKPRTRRRGRADRVATQAVIPGEEQTSLVGQLLVPLTTRLQPKTAEMLRRACLEQKLRGKRPHTQQDIIELATQAWLRENGYYK